MSHDNELESGENRGRADDVNAVAEAAAAAGTADEDGDDGIDEDEYRTCKRDNIYYAAKDGSSIALASLLSNESEDVRDAIINKVCQQ